MGDSVSPIGPTLSGYHIVKEIGVGGDDRVRVSRALVYQVLMTPER